MVVLPEEYTISCSVHMPEILSATASHNISHRIYGDDVNARIGESLENSRPDLLRVFPDLFGRVTHGGKICAVHHDKRFRFRRKKFLLKCGNNTCGAGAMNTDFYIRPWRRVHGAITDKANGKV